MTEQNLYDLIIIGSGPGGLTAGIYAMRAAMKTVLIEKGIAGGQLNNTDEVENWPGTVKITGAELAVQFANHAESFGLETLAREVVAVVPGQKYHLIKLDNGDILHSYTVIIATGGSPKKLNIHGEKEYYGKGVSYCAVCDGFFFRNKNLVVVGGGNSAAEESMYLAKIANKVYIAHRRDALRADIILQKQLIAQENIEIMWNTVLTAINADNSGVCGVDIKDTKTGDQWQLTIDGVFVFIGFVPNNQLVPAEIAKNGEGYVITDYKCETNISGIYAIGDLSEKYAKQIVTAAADGCTAALAAAHYVESKKSGFS